MTLKLRQPRFITHVDIIIVVLVKPFVSLVVLASLLPLLFAFTPFSDQRFGVKDFMNNFKP